MAGVPLTDGRAVFTTDNELTYCSCWQITFGRWTYHPVLIVPRDTSLDDVEALGRRALAQYLDAHNTQRDHAADVAEVSVESVQRLQFGCLDPRLG